MCVALSYIYLYITLYIHIYEIITIKTSQLKPTYSLRRLEYAKDFLKINISIIDTATV